MTRRRVAALLAIAGVALGVAGLVVLGGSGTPARGGPPIASSAAVVVERRDLVLTDTESGTLGYADPETVYDRLGGTITWLPAVGEAIDPGGELYAVDGAPVVLFAGATPAYRELAPGVGGGADVLELNRDLVDLGFDPEGQIALDDDWQSGTTDAVRRWQASRGLAQTGTIALGRIVFLPGAQVVTAVDPQLGSDVALSSRRSPAQTPAVAGSAARSDGSAGPHAELVDLTTSTTSTTHGHRPGRAADRALRAMAARRARGARRARRRATAAPRERAAVPRRRPRPGSPPAASSSPSVAALERLLRADTQQLKADAAALKRRPTATPPAATSGPSPSGGAG